MTIEILYSQSYMQTNGQMTVDILLKNPETADIVIGTDMYTTDLPPKVNGPRMVACVPKNTPCYSIRYINIPFTDPYRIYVKRCISGPNCAGPGCTTFGTISDSVFVGEMVDFGSPGISGVPREIFGSPHPVPSNIQGTCVPPPPPPPISVLNVTGVTAELSVSDLFPGSQGWTRINVTATGSGMLSISVDGVQLLTDGPLNPGATPFTFTYLKQLTAGTKNICVQAVGGNKVCTSITVPGVIIRKDSCLTINTRNTPPFSKGENVAIYGILEECGPILNPDITGADLIIKIKINSTEVKSYATRTFVSTSIGENWSYVWSVPSTYGASLDTAGKNITVEVYYYGDATHGPIAKTSVIGTIEAAAPPPPVGFTLSTDKTAITSGDYVVFSGTYSKAGQKIGIYSNKGYITTTVTNISGAFKVGEVVTVPPSTDTTAVRLTINACTEGAISGICPLLADKSNNITIDVTPKAIVPPPLISATHAFVINLSPLSWANLGGLTAYLPNITSEFAKAITMYGWLGWQVVESRMEDSKLVIYLMETAAVGSMGLSETASKVRALALPALAAVIAALGTIATIALSFGYIILGFYIVNLLTKAVEVSKTQADTEQIRTKTVSDMCKSGALTPEQCSEALKPPAEKGICETFGFSAVACDQVKTGILIVGGTIGAYLLYKATKTVA